MKTILYTIILLLAHVFYAQAQECIDATGAINEDGSLSASRRIRLLPGFEAKNGVNFRAYISEDESNLPDGIEVNSYASTSGDHNYVREYTLLTRYSTMPSLPRHFNETVKYFDGLGRPDQVIQVNASPKGNNIITPITYDNYGRKIHGYLPYVASGLPEFRNNAPSECVNYYSSMNDGRITDNKPFTINIFDDSPLNRIVSSTGIGKDWHDKGKDISKRYTTNDGYTISSWNSNGRALQFQSNSLFIETTTDENGNDIREYKDRSGNVVLKEVVNDQEVLKTYYIYNARGLLSIVVPPLASSPADEDLCFFYKYDDKGRMIEKDIPGAEPVYMIYDDRDRLILTQDGNLRRKGKFLFTWYDVYNRPVMTGFIEVTLSLDEIRNKLLEATIDSDQSVVKYDFHLYDDPGDQEGHILGYDISGAIKFLFEDVTEDDILTAIYYDNYDFLNYYSNTEPLRYGSYQGFASKASDRTIGKITGSYVKVLDATSDITNPNIVETLYYDFYGNLIRNIQKNHMNRYDVVTNKYEDITFRLLETVSSTFHNIQSEELTVAKSYSYDKQGRVIDTYCKVNNQDKIVLKSNEYNELGEVKQKHLYSKTLSTNRSYKQNIDYTYNVRGWLKSINNPALSNTNDLFGMTLYYNDAEGVISSSRLPASNANQYNGNISAIVYGTSNSSTPTSGYGFSYDGANRLKNALYGEGLTLNTGTGLYSESVSSYDANGNIKRLGRYYKGTKVDDLEYIYANGSNQLQKVNDLTGINQEGLNDYEAQTSSNYLYDDNGNLKTDPGKGTTIEYNHLNLPKCINFSGKGKIYYFYDAIGNKLAQIVESNTSSDDKRTDYSFGKVYSSEGFFKTHEEGRIIPKASPYDDDWEYEYDLKDHLGNNRVTFAVKENGETELRQTNHYYPFGLAYNQKNHSTASSKYIKNKYLYNGKELQDDGFGGISLDWYDYGARFYDPAIGRWHVNDPLCEYAYNMTPYHYVKNNPMKYIDPLGLIEERFEERNFGWKFWKKKEGDIEETDVVIDEVTVTAKDLSTKPNKLSIWLSQWGWYSQPGGMSFYGGGGWCANSAANTTNGGDINHLLALLSGGGMGGFSGGPLSAATAINKAGSAYVEGEGTVLRPDYKIKKESTGTGQETDSKGQTASVKKQAELESQVKTDTTYTSKMGWVTHKKDVAKYNKYKKMNIFYKTGSKIDSMVTKPAKY